MKADRPAAEIDCAAGTVCRAGAQMCAAGAVCERGRRGVYFAMADGFGGAGATAFTALALGLLRRMDESGDTVGGIARSLGGAAAPGSVFTLGYISDSGLLSCARRGLPELIVLRRGRPVSLALPGGAGPVTSGEFLLAAGDAAAAVNGGFIAAGASGRLGRSWSPRESADCAGNIWRPGITAAGLTRLLLRAASSLAGGRPPLDLAVISAVCRRRRDGV